MIRARVTKQEYKGDVPVPPNRASELVVRRAGTILASFEELEELSEQFLKRVVQAIETNTETLSRATAYSRARSAKFFLTFVACDSSPEAEHVRSGIRAGDVEAIEPSLAHVLELNYRSTLADRYRAGSATLASVISNTNVVIRLFASRGLWPHTMRLPPEILARDGLRPRPSLLEALGEAGKQPEDLRDPNSRLESAVDGLRFLELDVPRQQDKLSTALLEGERVCLNRLRSVAQRLFDQTYSAWSTMQPLIELAAREDEELLSDWLQEAMETVAAGGRNQSFELLTTDLFPSTLQGLARLLALLESFYMRGTDSAFHTIDESLQASMSRRLRTVAYRVRPVLAELNIDTPHDLHKIRGLLTSSRDAVRSAAVLLMAETGLNTTPLINLPWDQVRETNDPRWISIASWKERANGSLIEEELDVSPRHESTSAGAALVRLREMSARHSNFVGMSNSMQSLVFAHAVGHAGEAEKPRMKTMTNNNFRASFDSVAADAFGPNCDVYPSSVRPSLLMTLRGHTSNIRRAQLAAGHKSADTTLRSYAGQHRSVHHLDQMRSIRAFQERLQQIAIHNLDNSSRPDDIPASADRLNDAIDTGLGVLCIRLSEHSGRGTPDCLSLENCPGCSRLQISTQPDNLADLLAFGDHLAHHESWLQTYRPESWLTRWLPWSLLVEEIQRRGSRSSWAPSLKKARDINASRNPPSFPPLW